MRFKWGYLWVTGLLFLFSLIGHWLFAWFDHAEEARAHGQALEIGSYVVKTAEATVSGGERGPFEITMINPGGEIELGISTSEACDGVAWFSYSGGGAAVGEGEILCARSSRDAPVTQGFSGH